MPKRRNRELDSSMSEVYSPIKTGESEFNGAKILRMPNGDIEVTAGEEGPRVPKQGDFDENLAEYLTNSQRQSIAQELLEQFEEDKDSRKDWELREEIAVDMLGIQRDPGDSADSPKKLTFPSSKGHEVTFPLISEAATQFNARALAEIFPPEGPVKVTALGSRRQQTVIDQAERVQTFMNYYLTEVDREYFDDVDSMLFYLSLMGSAFKKVAIDVRTGLPTARYVKATNFIVPYSARSLQTAARFHHHYPMVETDYQKAVALGYYMDTAGIMPGFMAGSAFSKAEDRADYRNPSVPREEAILEIVESHALYSLPLKFKRNRDDRNQVRPYVFHIDKDNNEITRISRAWSEHDNTYRRRSGVVHYKFLPGLGFYGFGYLHFIGSLGRSASGAVNSLLDAATASNFQGGFKTKSGRGIGDVELEHGVWKEVDADAEDLTKSFFTPPFKGPEPAMFQLLTGLVEAGRRFASIQDSQVGAGNNTGPVGTTVALIEEGSRVYTAIHKRLHKAARDEFAILADLIHEYMPDRYPYETKGEEQMLLRSDFDGRVDVAPVSDPNIFSSTQRIAIAQNVIQLQMQAPDLYSRKQRIEAHRALIKSLRVPDWEAVAPMDKRPNYQDPVTENMLMLLGQAVQSFPHQLHQVHIAAHQNFLQIQQGMMDPKEFAQLQSTITAHIREHMAMAYRQEVERRLGIPLPPVDLTGENMEDLPPDIEAAISVAVAQNLLPPPPTPEEQAASQEVMDEKARKDAETIAKIERDTAAWEADQQRQQGTFEAEEARRQAEFEAEQQREDERAAAELIRQQAQTAAGLQIEAVKGVADIQRRGAAATHDLQMRNQKGELELSHRKRMGDHDLQTRGAKANLELGTRSARAKQDMEIVGERAKLDRTNRSMDAAQQRTHKAQSATQDMKLRDKSAAQDRKHKAIGGKQQRAQERETHKQGMQIREQTASQGLQERQRKAELDAKIAEKRALGNKKGAAKRKTNGPKE